MTSPWKPAKAHEGGYPIGASSLPTPKDAPASEKKILSDAKEEEEDALQVWVEKYRPKQIQDISGQEKVKEMLVKVIDKGKANMPHMLFYGPPGTGKTTTALALCYGLFGENYRQQGRVLEMNASDERGIDAVRTKVKGFAEQDAGAGFKIIILDEADTMTRDAQSALRRIIELYTFSTRFIIICNYVSRIMDALVSRTTKFHFTGVPRDQQIARIQMICEKERVLLEEDAVDTAIEIGDGDLRRTLTLLQGARSYYGERTISSDEVREVAGAIPMQMIYDLLELTATAKSVVEVYETVQRRVFKAGYNGYQLLVQVGEAVMEIAGTKRLPDHKFPRVAELLGDSDLRMVDGADEELQLLHLFARLWWIMGPNGDMPPTLLEPGMQARDFT